jgi:hypothetical protein
VQSNVVGETVNDAIPQLSVALTTSWATEIDPVPVASKDTTTGVGTRDTIGSMLSTTVTAIAAVLVLPDPSTAVTVTVLIPNSVHVNAVLL